MPCLDSVYKLSTAELKGFSLVSMRWVSGQEDSKLSFKIRPSQVRANNANQSDFVIEKCE
jgi:hypothetical protein